MSLSFLGFTWRPPNREMKTLSIDIDKSFVYLSFDNMWMNFPNFILEIVDNFIRNKLAVLTWNFEENQWKTVRKTSSKLRYVDVLFQLLKYNKVVSNLLQ